MIKKIVGIFFVALVLLTMNPSLLLLPGPLIESEKEISQENLDSIDLLSNPDNDTDLGSLDESNLTNTNIPATTMNDSVNDLLNNNNIDPKFVTIDPEFFGWQPGGKTVKTTTDSVNKTVKAIYRTTTAVKFDRNLPVTKIHGLFVDENGYIYITTSDNYVRKYSSEGGLIFEFGGTGSGDGQFDIPVGITVDADGDIFVADVQNFRIQKFNKTGGFILKFGILGSGNGEGVFVDVDFASNGNVFVADVLNYRVQKFTSTGTYISKWGSYGTGDGYFKAPFSITVDRNDNDNVFVADSDNHDIQKFTSTGGFTARWGGFGSGDGQFKTPRHIAIDSNGDLLITDGYNYRVQKFTSTGTYISKWGSYGTGDGQFISIGGIGIDAYGNIYVTEEGNEIKKFSTITNYDVLTDYTDIFLDDDQYFLDSLPLGFYLEFSTIYDFFLYDLKNPENIGVNFAWMSITEASDHVLATDTMLSVELTGNYGNNELRVEVEFIYGYDNIEVILSVFDAGSNFVVTDTYTSQFVFVNELAEFQMSFDYVYAQNPEQESILRSEFRKIPNSDRFEHRIFINSPEYRNNITIYAPLDWNFSRIEPSTPVTLLGDNYLLNDTISSIYDMYFLSGSGFGRDYARQKQIVAIEDVTDDYLQDSSFENGYSQDWDNHATYSFETLSNNYSIVFDGISSLQIIDSDGSTDLLGLNIDRNSLNGFILDNGYYYAKVSYYVNAYTSGSLWYSTYDSAWISVFVFDMSITDRWITNFFYFNINSDDGYSNFDLRGNSWIGDVFIDNFKIYKVNTVVETTGSSETTIASQFFYWTDYGLYYAINENVTLQLRDMTANTIIDSYSAYTDSLGIISWIWQGNLEPKSYEVRSTAWNSWFNNEIPYDYSTETIIGWNPSTENSISLETSNTKNNNAVKITKGSPADVEFLNPIYTFVSNIDISNVEYISFWQYRDTVSANAITFNFYLYTNWNNYILANTLTQCDIEDTWCKVTLSLDSFSIVGSPDLSNIDFIYYRLNINVDIGDYVIFDSFQMIQSQKYYFTPKAVSYIDYAENDLENSWDWEIDYVVDNAGEVEYFLTEEGDSIDYTEGDDEQFESLPDATQTISYGTNTVAKTGTGQYISTWSKDTFPLNIEPRIYPTLVLTIKSLLSSPSIIRLTEINYNIFGMCTRSYSAGGLLNLTTTMVEYHFYFSNCPTYPQWFESKDEDNIVGNIDKLKLVFYHGDGTTQTNFPISDVYEIDSIELVGKTEFATHVKGDSYDFQDSLEYFYNIVQNVSDFDDGSLENWIVTNYGSGSNEQSEYLKLVSDVTEYFKHTLGNESTFNDGSLEGFTDEFISNYFRNILLNVSDFKDGSLENFTDQYFEEYFKQIYGNELDFNNDIEGFVINDAVYNTLSPQTTYADISPANREHFSNEVSDSVDFSEPDDIESFTDGTIQVNDWFWASSNFPYSYAASGSYIHSGLGYVEVSTNYEYFEDRRDYPIIWTSASSLQGFAPLASTSLQQINPTYMRVIAQSSPGSIGFAVGMGLGVPTADFDVLSFSFTTSFFAINTITVTDGGNDLCVDTTGWSASGTHAWSCDLSLDSDWTGTINDLFVIFGAPWTNGAWVQLGGAYSNYQARFTLASSKVQGTINSVYIQRTGLSIDSSKYGNFEMRFHGAVLGGTDTITRIKIYDSSSNVLCDDTVSINTGIYYCGLQYSQYWTGTETTIKIEMYADWFRDNFVIIDYIEINQWIEPVMTKSSLSIDASAYNYAELYVYGSLNGIDYVDLLDSSSNTICSNFVNSTGGVYVQVFCDLSGVGAWTGTETEFKVKFNGSYDTNPLYWITQFRVDYIKLWRGTTVTNEGNDYLKFTNVGINRNSLSIDASLYSNLVFAFNNSVTIDNITIYDSLYIGGEDPGTPICQDLTGWSSGSSFKIFSCDLLDYGSGLWSGTETQFSIVFNGSSVGTLYIDYVELWRRPTVTNEETNYLKFTSEGIKRDSLSIDTSLYETLQFRFNTSVTLTEIIIYDSLYTGFSIDSVCSDTTGWSAGSSFYTFSCDLSLSPNWDSTVTSFSIVFISSSTPTIFIDYVELFAENQNSIGQTSLSIDSSVYRYFTMEFNTTHVIESVIIYDGTNPVCQDNSIGSSADYWYLFTCDLGLNASWTGTETALKISFTYAGTTHAGQTIFINVIYLYNASLGDRENIAYDVLESGYSYVRPEGVLYGFHGWESATRGNFFETSDTNEYVPSTTIFETKIRIYGTPNPVTSYNVFFGIYDNSYAFQGDSDIFDTISENDGWVTISYDLSQDSLYSTLSVVGKPRLYINAISKFEMEYMMWFYNPSPNLDLESFYEEGGRDLINNNGQLIVEQDLNEDSSNVNISRAISTFDSTFYDYFQTRIKTDAQSGQYQFRVEDQDYNILSSWAEISGNNFNYIEFYFSTNDNWTDDISILRIHISLLSGTALDADKFYLDFVGIVHKDSNITMGYAWEFEQDDYLDDWIINGEAVSNGVSNGIWGVDITDQWDGIKYEKQIVDSFDYIVFEAKATTTVLMTVAKIDSSPVYSYFTLTTDFQTFKIDFSDYIWNDIYFAIWEKNGQFTAADIYFKYIRLVKDSLPNLQEADSYFVLENEDEFYYNIWSDNVSLGQYRTTQPIPKNQSYGFHTLHYQMFNRITLSGNPTTGHYVPGMIYEFSYENYLIYSAVVNTFISSDFFLSIYYTANKPTDYIVYENSTSITSGSSDGSGQSVEWDKNIDVGLVLIGIKFTVSTNASEFLWFNTSYGNDLVILITSFSTYTNNTHVIIEYTSATTSISINITEDGLFKGSFSNSPITFAKSGSPGQHFVNVLFLKQYFTSVTFSFAYTTENFFISNLQFYTTETEVFLDWTAISTGSRDYATIELNDAWDFNDDEDNWNTFYFSQSGGLFSGNPTNGLGSGVFTTYSASGLEFSTDYQILTIRMKVTDPSDSDFKFRLYISNTTTEYQMGAIYTLNSNEWLEFEVLLTDDEDFLTLGFGDRLRFLWSDTAFSNWDGDETIDIDYITLEKQNVRVEIFEDGTSKGVFTTNANYTISTIPGNHFISAIFFSPDHNNLTFGFFYTINDFSIETLNFYTTTDWVILTWASDLSNVQVELFENGESKGDFSSSPSNYTIAIIPGTYFVTAIFFLSDHTNLTFSYIYTISNFVIESINFYITDNLVFLIWSSDLSGVQVEIYQDGVNKGTFSDDVNYSISIVPDNYFVTAIFYLANHNNLTYGFSYVVNNFAVDYLAFYTNITHVNLDWTAINTEEKDYAIIELNDAWDFNEGDTEGFTGESFTVLDNALNYIGSATFIDFIFLDPGDGLDNNTYESIIIKIKTNISKNLYINSGDVFIGATSSSYQVFTVDYSNFFTVFYLNNPTNDPINVSVDYVQILRYDVRVELFENGISKGVFSNDVSYVISATPGTYFVSAVFFLSDHTNLTFSYSYTINNFAIESINFYTTTDWVILSWSSDLAGVEVEIYQDGASKGTFSGDVNYSISAIPGNHFVGAIFYLANHNNLSYSFLYDIDNFLVESINFYTTTDWVVLIWSSDLAGVQVDLLENGVSQGTYSTSPSNYTKSAITGVYYITATFFLVEHNNISYNFVYEVNNFFITSIQFQIVSDFVSITWSSSLSGIGLQLYDDGINKGIFSSSPSQYAQNTTEGLHYVSAIFYLTGHNNISNSFSYETNPILITNTNFYTNETYVNLDWSATSDASRDYATIELNDAWDFNEGDVENYYRSVGATNSLSIDSDSLLIKITSSSYYYTDIQVISNINIDLSLYKSIIVKIKSNNTEGFKIQGKSSGITTITSQQSTTEVNNYVTFILPITSSGIITSFGLLIYNISNINFDATEGFWIDYIQLLKDDVQVELFEDGITKGVFSTSICSYIININQGQHLVTALFFLNGFSNISYNFQYTVSQFVITSEIFYTNYSHFSLEWTADQTNVNITIKEDGILKQDSTNVSSLTLAKRDIEGSHFLTLTYSKPGHNSISNLETYQVEPIRFTNFLWSVNGTHVNLEFNITEIVDVKVYRDFVSYANITSTNGEFINITKIRTSGDHIIILQFNRTGYNLVTKALQYNIQIAPLIDEDIIEIDVNETTVYFIEDTTQEAINAIIIFSTLMISAVGLSILFVYLYNRNRQEFRDFAKNLPEDIQKIITERRERSKTKSNRFARSSTQKGEIERITPFK
ncbi:hypothetical protein LCGC14_0504810 [marine sediment metagenome]|uniref:Uncharacterized protein n=1 Tax=marine sediment metagenome TaxID=412755 RepID=A0A0F9VBE6_9ZZZZ